MRPFYNFLFLVVLFIPALTGCNYNESTAIHEHTAADSVLKVEMKLSAYGVESDDYPNIDVTIDFANDSANCRKWYFKPSHKNKNAAYALNKKELDKVWELLMYSDLGKLKKEYKVPHTDQASSVTTIYTKTQKFEINDYGLEGDHPLRELYKIVYKLHYDFHQPNITGHSSSHF